MESEKIILGMVYRVAKPVFLTKKTNGEQNAVGNRM